MPEWLDKVLIAALGALSGVMGALLIWHRRGQELRLHTRTAEIEAERVEITSQDADTRAHEAATRAAVTTAQIADEMLANMREYVTWQEGRIDGLLSMVKTLTGEVKLLTGEVEACRAREARLQQRVDRLEQVVRAAGGSLE